jgi:NifU-like protein involved in Fe-S cluster formation
MNATQVRDIRALVAASNFGDTVTCTAYVGGATTEAIAAARATSACATATAANSALTAVIRTAKAIPASRNTVRVVIG